MRYGLLEFSYVVMRNRSGTALTLPKTSISANGQRSRQAGCDLSATVSHGLKNKNNSHKLIKIKSQNKDISLNHMSLTDIVLKLAVIIVKIFFKKKEKNTTTEK